MSLRRLFLYSFLLVVPCAPGALGQFKTKYLRITIPRGSVSAPVQRLNRVGVQALLKQKYEAAEEAFNKAYLYDPTDPFTLNNLGYVSELQGELDRAQKFYKLAAEQGCYAIIDRSSVKELKGKPMLAALGTGTGTLMRVNSMNILAMELLSEGRAFDAVSVLDQALALDPENGFTLNNLGVAEEATGDLEAALEHYERASTSVSTQKIVVTEDRAWRGKPLTLLAYESAQALRARIRGMDPNEIKAVTLSIRGVAAVNHNNWSVAKQDFSEAYALQPTSAFTLNNLGYVAEREGDFETAGTYYELAQKAPDAGARVGLSSDFAARGQRLTAVADANLKDVDAEQEAYKEERRRRQLPLKLIPRDSKPQPEVPPAKPGTAPPGSNAQPSPQ
ncbi:MAG TPA: tetratricopeptide repeat protein [Acidisarcina sp.]